MEEIIWFVLSWWKNIYLITNIASTINSSEKQSAWFATLMIIKTDSKLHLALFAKSRPESEKAYPSNEQGCFRTRFQCPIGSHDRVQLLHRSRPPNPLTIGNVLRSTILLFTSFRSFMQKPVSKSKHCGFCELDVIAYIVRTNAHNNNLEVI